MEKPSKRPRPDVFPDIVHVVPTSSNDEYHSVLDSPASLLQTLLGPQLKSIDFMKDHFQSRAVHVKGPAERFSNILETMGDVSQIFESTSSEDGIFVWIVTDNRKIQSLTVEDVDSALALHQAGHATYCRASEEVEQALVPALLQDTNMGCGDYRPHNPVALARGEVEVFCTNAPHTTGWHTDFQENFTLQLSGVKEWRLQKAHVKHPIRGCTPHYAVTMRESQTKAVHLCDSNTSWKRPEDEEIVVKLTPGDVLYHPAGIWHSVQSVEPGISINVSLMATNYATLTSQAIQHVLQKDARFRQVVRHDAAHLEDLLRNALPELIEQLTGPSILPPVLSMGQEEDDHEEDESEEVRNKLDDADVFPVSALPNGRLRINPLGMLQQTEDGFILDVSFGGNESLESYVNKRFYTRRMDKFKQWMDSDQVSPPSELHPLISYLFHHGYVCQ